MAKKSKRAKMCRHNKEESCYNCAHKISITDEKTCITVCCAPKYGERTLEFDRRVQPIPYCGAYTKG